MFTSIHWKIFLCPILFILFVICVILLYLVCRNQLLINVLVFLIACLVCLSLFIFFRSFCDDSRMNFYYAICEAERKAKESGGHAFKRVILREDSYYAKKEKAVSGLALQGKRPQNTCCSCRFYTEQIN